MSLASAAYLVPAFWALVGLAVGSFLNVVADRLPRRQSLLAPPSHCAACQRRLAAFEMIPVISFLALRGRCRTCGAPIGARTVWVELAGGALYALAAWQIAPDDGRAWLDLLLTSIYLAVFIVVTVTDLEHGLILDAVTLPTLALALVGTLIVAPRLWLMHCLSGAAGAAIIILVIVLVPHGMGWGDVKLTALVGMVTGWPGVALALFTAFVSGGIVAAILLATGRKQRGQTIPLGPFLAFGGGLALLYHAEMLWAFYALARLM